MNDNKDRKNTKYKITNQSGLYYESDLSRIVDDHISDNIFTRVVKIILYVSMAVTIWSSYLSKNIQPVSCSFIIAAIILYIICCILNNRIITLLSLYKDDNDALEKAVKSRKAFVYLRYSALAFSILSVILSLIGI